MLFAALAFFAVGQAALTRSDAQGAADAAALAAAGDARDHLLPGLEIATLRAADWERVLEGDLLSSAGACEQAHRFAERNNAVATCTQAQLRFSVEVTTNGTVGQSVIPGTSGLHGQARATAAIEPRCSLAAAPSPEPSATPSPSGTAGPGSGATTRPSQPRTVRFKCKGGASVELDTAKGDLWRKVAKSLFDVRLVD
ncbi:hypothetical protein C0216_04130 [Streptomyces globosus]|uniref:Putative Flp pilus-assembly TadG-like N-terminal domain-containing protein n=2 Tax=Streptomyces globosus TaxID=68209 RepID=A0A344U8Q7_9ACTN|nr:hypothetical protein C0216_04130 [Streptomyces globosus]